MDVENIKEKFPYLKDVDVTVDCESVDLLVLGQQLRDVDVTVDCESVDL